MEIKIATCNASVLIPGILSPSNYSIEGVLMHLSPILWMMNALCIPLVPG